MNGLIHSIDDICYFSPEKIEILNMDYGNGDGKMNSRTIYNPGFLPEKMKSLREGIQNDGLNNPITIQISKDGNPQLVAGERRLKSILQLLFDDKKAQKEKKDRVLVYDSIKQDHFPASEVYGKRGIQCKIVKVTDRKDLIRRNVQENTLHEPLTEYEILLQCQKMEMAKISRVEQASILNISEAWISQSHTLLDSKKVHSSIIEAMEKGLLPRTAAVTFINVPYESQEETLSKAIQKMYGEAEDKIKVIEDNLEVAKKELVAGEAELSLSKYLGESAKAKVARRNIDRAMKRIDKNNEKIDEINRNSLNKKVSVEAVTLAAKELEASGEIHKPQSNKKIRKTLNSLRECLSKNGDRDSMEVEGKDLDPDELKLAEKILSWVLDQNYADSLFEIFNEV